MLTLLCKKLRANARFLKHNDWNTSLGRHFFSTEALESRTEDGKGLLGSLRNPKSVVVGAPDKVEITKTLLRKYGFTDTQLSKLYAMQPRLFTSVPEKTLLPKLEFFRGLGLSNTDLAKIACSNSYLLGSSLQNQIVPFYNFIKSLFLPDSYSYHQLVVGMLKFSYKVLACSVEKRIAPNVASLREAGVPNSRILFMLRWHPTALGSSRIRESIKKASEMGLDPNKLSFVLAVRVFAEMSESFWDKKMEVYRRCGMSDDDILKAFRSNPSIMLLGEQNIVETVDFVVKKMGWQPVDLARNPAILCSSLEKRIIPRCTVVRYLQGKGLIKKTISLGTFLTATNEKDFVNKFVKKYENDVPGLMDMYLGKIAPPQEPRLSSDM